MFHRSVSLLVVALVATTFQAAPTLGATLCVNPGGTGGCFSTIQAAVDAAGKNDVINIAAGTYTENVTMAAFSCWHDRGRRWTRDPSGRSARVPSISSAARSLIARRASRGSSWRWLTTSDSV